MNLTENSFVAKTGYSRNFQTATNDPSQNLSWRVQVLGILYLLLAKRRPHALEYIMMCKFKL